MLFKREASQFPLIIGRKAPADIIIENAFVSNSHCRLSKVGEKFLFEDLNSTNGSFVGRKKVESFEIDDLANIRIGTEIFLFFSVPVQDLEIEEKTRVPIPPTTRDDILVRQPQAFTLMEHNYKRYQFFREVDLDHFLLPFMDLSYKSFLTLYFMAGTLFATLFQVTFEQRSPVLAAIDTLIHLTIFLLVMLVLAGLLTLPGWLAKRGSSFKRIYFVLIIWFLIVHFEKYVLLPFTVSSTTGLVFKILCHSFLILGALLVQYVFFGSIIDRKVVPRLTLLLLGMLIIPAAFDLIDHKNLDQKSLREIYERDAVGFISRVPMPEQSVDEATAALMDFDKTLRAPAQTKSNQ
ncbi:MAG: FHA domain-containing protein [Bdellovibrionales bacterium]|nr:FHA domain-containing protein [Bdellovibrionales bacterium]